MANGVLSLSLILSLSFQWFSPKKIAYVQTAQLINEYQGMAQARNDYQIKAQQWQANIDTLAMEWQREVETYQKEQKTLTQKEKELTEQLLDQKQKQLREYQAAIQEQAQQEDLAMTERVLGEINTFIEAYGKSNGYEIIIAATDMGNLAYATDGLDITREILEGLNTAPAPIPEQAPQEGD